jgi:hypothetical protein|uniref:Uncharacterized protein n=1 Tax=viral metagenome TaxID=1070528 RepID=A0A6C0C4F6_9ZZZZ
MLTDIILSDIPFPHGKEETIIMRVEEPTKITWDSIFAFIEEKSQMPRCVMAGSDSNGKYIYGKYLEYPDWVYDSFRLCQSNGKMTSAALVRIHSTPWAYYRKKGTKKKELTKN